VSTPAGRANAPAEASLDVCHGGVVLRSLLFVHGAAAAVLGLQQPGWWVWMSSLALLTVWLLPATLLWLLLMCRVERGWLRAAIVGAASARRSGWHTRRLALAAGLGGLCGVLPWLGWRTLAGRVLGEALAASFSLGLLAALACGAALAAVIAGWLDLRQRLAAPATDAARLAELQSRIRPHFLFNTLNSAIALVQVDPARAETMLEDLAELFRAALGEAGSRVTLASEIELARRYLEIEAVRFGQRLRVHWQLDEAAGRAELPALVLQPLVENAVRHGVELRHEGGDIFIRTRLLGGGTQAEVLISNALADLVRPGQGMALANVAERLRVMHDVALVFVAGVVEAGAQARAALPTGVDSRLGELPRFWRVRFVVPLPRPGD
jgi:two-component system sensor histidine kinase AlgZ